MKLLELLGIEHPIIQAPMAGVTTPEFVAASSNCGVLGSIGAGYLSADETREFVQAVKKRTDRPFAVNLFVPEEVQIDQELFREAYEALQPIGEKLGMPFWKVPLSSSQFDQQIEVVIQEQVDVCSFTFGLPKPGNIKRLKEAGVLLIGTATSVEEACAVEKAGLDAVVVQGSEAGGHRGSFIGTPLIPLQELLQDAAKAVSIPIIAAGGISDRNSMTKMLELGAQAVQIGTALLASQESGAHPLYKQAVLRAEAGSTVLTDTFSGKMARGIQNGFMNMMQNAPIAPYPVQNDLTKKIRSEAAKKGKPEFMSMWAGEQVHHTTEGTVEEILRTFIS
ncbi:nitronate monooxygenase family protein [Sporosarcina sp. Te-1]|uniref:NAD(P)H-dependent flavin oxidoreductase n=1 Tax=Sporosarcina sp. Te-1 TaxID=2818390 RepID=UPI001A9FB9FF|nr:nitronate monooxygenase [Sporosarcina sp. Te-1]QTD39751.1 nitronate monooxygenase [Sporosarcina sp. Te-1]